MKRKGMMKGSGKRGYHNIIPKDPSVHSQSARGMKQPYREDKFIRMDTNEMDKYADMNSQKTLLARFRMNKATDAEVLDLFSGIISQGKHRKKGQDADIVLTAEMLIESGIIDDKGNIDKIKVNAMKHGNISESIKKALVAGKEFAKKEGAIIAEGAKKAGATIVETEKKAFELAKEKGKELGKELKMKAGKLIESGKGKFKQLQSNLEKKRLERFKEDLSEIKHPEVEAEKKQRARVNTLQSQIISETDPTEVEKLEKELDTEEEQLRQIEERITEIKIEDLSDKQLRELAVKIKPPFFSLSDVFSPDDGAGNIYEKELYRRAKKRKQIDKKLVDIAKTPTKKQQEGEGITGLLGLGNEDKKQSKKGLLDDLF